VIVASVLMFNILKLIMEIMTNSLTGDAGAGRFLAPSLISTLATFWEAFWGCRWGYSNYDAVSHGKVNL
jgi:hypothetical protein